MTDRPPRSVLERIGAAISMVEKTVGVVSLLVILTLVFVQALQRHLPLPQIAWTGELARFAMLWLTFMACGLLVTTRGHIAMEFLDTMKNKRAVQFVQAFAMAMVTIIGVGLSYEAWALVETQNLLRSAVLGVPMSWIYIPVLIGCVSTTIRAAVATFDVVRHGPVLPTAETDAPEVVPS